jgi:VIT1/CCC1 family predicted Fe2+/Mn2+ transporter
MQPGVGDIDALLYLLQSLAERGRALMIFRAVRVAGDAEEARHVIAGALPPLLASVLHPAEFASMHERLKQLPEPPRRARLRNDDCLAAAAVFLLVFLSTFAVAIPFIVMHDAVRALRVSNGVAIAMLFLTGFTYGRLIGRHPWLVGISMVILGAVLSGLTIALGG